jgi:ABC transporter related protein
MNLLEVKNLKIKFQSRGTETEAVKGVDFFLRENESVAIVGESGSGKTVTAMSLTRLLPPTPLCQVSGDIIFDGRNVAGMGEEELRKIRGRQISYIFQEPSTSLNPVFTIGSQIAEAIRLHFPAEKDVRKRVVEALAEVGIRNPEKRYDAYPYELSGGMQQRAMIAMALACKPRMLVADEPTTALDVTIQKQIIDLLKSVREKRKMALLLITHNFGIISELCERVIVMFRGNIVEEGACKDVLYNPQHPYTRALINCVPRLGNRGKKLEPIDYDKL